MSLIELHDNGSECISYPLINLPAKAWYASSDDFPTLSEVNHWHDDYEIVSVKEGAMFYNIEGTCVELFEGQSIIVNSGRMHYGFQKQHRKCSVVCAMFNPSLVFTSATVQYYSVLCGNDASPFFVLDSSNSDDNEMLLKTNNLFEALLHTCCEFSIISSIYALCSGLLERINENDEDLSTQNRQELDIMHKMVGYIQQNYSRKVSLNDISSAGLVCRSRCCNIFKRYLKKTPVEYLTEYRIAKSIEMLSQTDLSITDIAIASGFCTSSYYTKTFKERLGLLPSEYRKRKS